MNPMVPHVPVEPELRAHIDRVHITEGSLFANVPQEQLSADERKALLKAGWTVRNYQDRPMMEPPELLLDWQRLWEGYRHATLDQIARRWGNSLPTWGENHRLVLEEVLASQWEEREDAMRALLAGWTFASAWQRESGEAADPAQRLEGRQVFFFYAESFRAAAREALDYLTRPPDADDAFWNLAEAVAAAARP